MLNVVFCVIFVGKDPQIKVFRCKFLSIVCDLDEEKLNVIRKLGFGGLLQLTNKELHYV